MCIIWLVWYDICRIWNELVIIWFKIISGMIFMVVMIFEWEIVYWSENDLIKLWEILIMFYDVEEYYVMFYIIFVEEVWLDLKDVYDGLIGKIV